MSHSDYFMLALCLWREARGEGKDGQIAVACVVRNRVHKRMSSYYVEVVKPLQFSSITDKGVQDKTGGYLRKPDPQLSLYPNSLDTAWKQCQEMAEVVCDVTIQDITNGATLYYADSIPFPPSWDKSKLIQTSKIGHHTFFREL